MRVPNFAEKTTENDKSFKACQSFKIKNKAVKRLRQGLQFMSFSEK